MLNFYVLAPLGALMFFAGFFPIAKVTDHVGTEPPTSIGNTSLDPDSYYRSNITKTVLFVIDALRLDFVTPTLMPSTWNLTRTPTGCFNVLKAETPTVTLPRIKALIAGSIPQFVDLISNLFGTEALADSLVHSAVRSGMRVVFYGDDTWLKLIPDKFVRYEGTHSFYVRDFREVDDNVTRNVERELRRDDWDIMILHYLGLDHIGHVHGPFSTLVPPKLLEMDRLIDRISTTLPTGTVLIVTGDHGMRDAGGHGGSTHPETMVPFLLTGIHCSDGTMAQTDVPVNLAALLGLPVPAASIGTVRSNLIFGLDRYLYAARYNGLALRRSDRTGSIGGDLFDMAERYHVLYLRGVNRTYGTVAGELYHNFSRLISENLIKSSVRQDPVYLTTGLLLLINTILTLLNRYHHHNLLLYSTLILLPFIDLTYPIYLPVLTVIFLVNLTGLIRSGFPIIPTTVDSKCLLLLLTVQPLTFASSSYVEEEHQYWYFATVTLYLLLLTKFKPVGSSLLLTGCFRFLRGLNATGDQWGDRPDLADWLMDNVVCYWIFFVIGLSLVLICLDKGRFGLLPVSNFLVVVSIFWFKWFDSIPMVGQLLWLSILTHLVLFKRKTQTWVLVCCLLLKPHNVILIPYCIAVSTFVQQHLTTLDNTLFHIFLSNLLYFCQGHSNSLASVDVSVGYVGLTSYNGPVVMLQVLLHTYAFPVLCYSSVLSNEKIDRDRFWTVLLLNRLYTFVVVAVVTFVQRHHLFIWSVFAPKLFVETVHVLVLFIGYLLGEVICGKFKYISVLYYLNKVRRS